MKTCLIAWLIVLCCLGCTDSNPPPPMPEPRTVLWPLKTLESAETSITVLKNGQLEMTITHEVLHGVSPEMLLWWYLHIEGTMTYAGKTYPRYLVWHPLDHIDIRVNRYPANGKGALVGITEAFGRNPDYLVHIDGVEQFLFDTTGVGIKKRVLGMQLFHLINKFVAVDGGTQVHTRCVVGTPSFFGRLGINRLIRNRLFPRKKPHAWLKHNVEEVGNLENFLPALYAVNTHAGLQEGDTEKR